jgi:hypothetical protein
MSPSAKQSGKLHFVPLTVGHPFMSPILAKSEMAGVSGMPLVLWAEKLKVKQS